MSDTPTQTIQFTGNYLKLTAEQWAHLNALAEATNSLAPTGTKAFQPSWRTLIKRIADGEFILVPNPEAYLKDGKEA
jgi:hypothetical protein